MHTPSTAWLRPLDEADLEAVIAIEQSAYSHPWTRGHFRDALASGYWAQGLFLPPPAPKGSATAAATAAATADTPTTLAGYVLAMNGVQETHLLNITVAPAHQGQGWALHMLRALVQWSGQQAAQCLWLEVRQSNLRALQVYQSFGFRRVGLRKDYYQADRQQREHAVVMSLSITPQPDTDTAADANTDAA